MKQILTLPQGFKAPEQLDLGWGIARKLCFRDAVLDFEAVMKNRDLIKATRGHAGEWPSAEMTLEDNMIDLAWHQREFEKQSSFAYTIMSSKEDTCLGCFYLYPPALRGIAGPDADVDISFWVIEEAYAKGYYEDLYKKLNVWLKEKWPFANPVFSNVKIP